RRPSRTRLGARVVAGCPHPARVLQREDSALLCHRPPTARCGDDLHRLRHPPVRHGEMKTRQSVLARLESQLATLLHWVPCPASALIGVGLLLLLLSGRDAHTPLAALGSPLMKAGIAVFISLPILRVVVMGIVFVRQRDFRFVAIAALVLIIILVSALLGIFA